MTRGIGLCIVIGNPNLLYLDPSWREWIEYCDENDCYRGCHCPSLRRHERDRSDADELMDLAMQSVLGGGYGDDEALSYEFSNSFDTAWRINL